MRIQLKRKNLQIKASALFVIMFIIGLLGISVLNGCRAKKTNQVRYGIDRAEYVPVKSTLEEKTQNSPQS